MAQTLFKDVRRAYIKEVTSSAGEWVTATADGHQVFATPPCGAARRLAIVFAAVVRLTAKLGATIR